MLDSDEFETRCRLHGLRFRMSLYTEPSVHAGDDGDDVELRHVTTVSTLGTRDGLRQDGCAPAPRNHVAR